MYKKSTLFLPTGINPFKVISSKVEHIDIFISTLNKLLLAGVGIDEKKKILL